ncbi:MAG: terminase family protein [Methanogenium sp.]|jgi:hypothetical protein
MTQPLQIQPPAMPEVRTVKDMVREEILKCAMSPEYFMMKYVYIQHPVRGRLLFGLYPFQKTTLKLFQEKRFNIILKSRQLGISTLTAAYALWLMLFHNDKKVLVIATKQDVAKNIIAKVRYAYKELPTYLKIERTEDNTLSQTFKNGSNIKAEAASDNAGRSEAGSLLILDEAAFIANIDKIWSASALTLATGGNAIVLSTPNGVGNWFWKMWTDSIEGNVIKLNDSDLTFNPIYLPWQVHPEHDQKWRDLQDEILKDSRLAKQECDCDFLASGNTVVPGEVIQWYKDTYMKDPIEKTGPGRNLWRWAKPDYTKTYIVSADVSRGDGTDFSTAQVFDSEACEQVAEFKGMIDTKDFGNFLVGLATEYNDALLVIENANVGWAVLQQVIDRSYKNLYYTVEKDVVLMDGNNQKISSFNKELKKRVAGFTTSSKTRPMIVDKIYSYFKDKSILIHSIRLINELFVFIWQSNRAEAQSGHNDDLVIGMGIGLYVRDTALKMGFERSELYKAMLKTMNVQRAETPVFIPEHPIQQNPWAMQLPDGEDLDLKQFIR